MADVYPEALNPVETRDTREARRQLESYLRYVCERSDFAIRSIGGGVSVGLEQRIKNAEMKISADESRITILEARKELPDVTSADSGKFLRVNAGGEWAAQAVPPANQYSF